MDPLASKREVRNGLVVRLLLAALVLAFVVMLLTRDGELDWLGVAAFWACLIALIAVSLVGELRGASDATRRWIALRYSLLLVALLAFWAGDSLAAAVVFWVAGLAFVALSVWHKLSGGRAGPAAG